MKKAQMFILTTVFLIGMIFVLQQVFMEYSFFNLPEQVKATPYYLARAVELGMNATLQQAPTCEQADANRQQFEAVVEQDIVDGYSIQIDTTANCSAFLNRSATFPALSGTVTIIGAGSQQKTDIILFRQ